MNPSCPLCKGTGRIIEVGFDGKTALPCPECVRLAQRRFLTSVNDYGTDDSRRRILDDLKRRHFSPPRGTPIANS